jgi:hypothetical protein
MPIYILFEAQKHFVAQCPKDIFLNSVSTKMPWSKPSYVLKFRSEDPIPLE